MLKLFHEIFGPEFFNHVAFIFTKWDKKKSCKAFRKRTEDTEAKKK
jgi:hypothetical protein